ncbi:MAG: BamA/TamA family outer membrane protein [Planctomycetales bacterium]|nr:BamA/TamA family outer membrane protein [Planctomycetales bacterium]
MRPYDAKKSAKFNSLSQLVALICLLSGVTGCQSFSPRLFRSKDSTSSLKPSSNATPAQSNGSASWKDSNSDGAKFPTNPRAFGTVRGQSLAASDIGSESSPSDLNQTPTPSNRYTYSPVEPLALDPPPPSSGMQNWTPPNSAAAAGSAQTAWPAEGGYTAEVPSLPNQNSPVAPQDSVLAAPTPDYFSADEPVNRSAGLPPPGYQTALAPGAGNTAYSEMTALAPGASPSFDPFGNMNGSGLYARGPRERVAPIDVYVQEARTGSIILGGAVNSDLGISGQLIIDERNFDLWRYPRSWDEMWSGRAFRGGGQNFRAEIMPGSQVQRYTLNWTEPHFRDLPYSLSVGGFLYTRQFRDWTEQRLGGRMALGYEVTKDLSVSSEIRMEDVEIFSPRIAGVQELDDALGSNDLYRARFRLAHDTRDNPYLSSEGGLMEIIYDQVFGEYDYSRGQFNLSRYFLMRERADGGGRHTLASSWKFGVTGSQTPIFENFFAGGYSTMRGFSFRGASPKVGDVQVGGEFMFLGSLEYVFPLTADEMLRGVAFVDYGTVETDLTINSENFRVAPGLGLRIAVPALGPAPLAFDFAVPINYADSDDRQVFSFFMGLTRS